MKNVLTFVLLFIYLSLSAQKKTPIILDADSGNEVDDLYAVSRALIEPSWDIIALNATHWQTSHWAIPETMENSHRINHVLLGELELSTKTRRGGVARMFDWGDMAQHSAATYEIIQQAKKMPDGEKLTVIALGALTNVASAIYIDPSIESKIELYWLGTTYDFEKDILKKLDFNCVMDVQAVDILFSSSVEMHVIPVNVAVNMEFDYAETKKNFTTNHNLEKVLLDRWYEHLDNGRKKRIIWDLALIEAIIHPEWAEQVNIKTSKENGNRTLKYYKTIDAKKMKADFFQQLSAYLQKL